MHVRDCDVGQALSAIRRAITHKVRASLCVFFFVLYAVASSANHLPQPKIAIGRSEFGLCGINVQHSSITEVLNKMGPPDAVEGEKDRYIWHKQGVRMEVGTITALDSDGNLTKDYVAYVAATGDKSVGVFGTTARGLRLGDTLNDLERLYGRRYVKRLSGGILRSITIEWKDTTFMEVAFSLDGRITEIKLDSPE